MEPSIVAFLTIQAHILQHLQITLLYIDLKLNSYMTYPPKRFIHQLAFFQLLSPFPLFSFLNDYAL